MPKKPNQPQIPANSGFQRIIEGKQEKVSYSKDSSVLLWINREFENYSDHWHNAVEIIMPVEGDYHVIVRRHSCHLKTGDILILPAIWKQKDFLLHTANLPADYN